MSSLRAIASVVIGASTAALLTVRAGAAAPLPLDYSAPAGCLDRAAFTREVSERLPRNVGTVQSVHVVIRRVSDEFVARLEVIDPGGATAEREISGVSCDKVSSAMALVVALVLTELADQKQQLPVPRSEPAAGSSPATTLAAAVPVTTVTPVPNTPPEAPALRLLPGPDTVRPSGPERSIPFELGLIGTATAGMTPGVAWGGLGYIEVGGFFNPAARLSLGARATRSVQSGPGAARFDWLGGRLDGCWPILAFGTAGAIAGCASFEAGVVRGYGDIDIPESTVDPWFAMGLLARPRLRAGDLVLQAELGPTFPLVRRDFLFGTESAKEATIHEVPAVSWHVGLGAGARL